MATALENGSQKMQLADWQDHADGGKAGLGDQASCASPTPALLIHCLGSQVFSSKCVTSQCHRHGVWRCQDSEGQASGSQQWTVRGLCGRSEASRAGGGGWPSGQAGVSCVHHQAGEEAGEGEGVRGRLSWGQAGRLCPLTAPEASVAAHPPVCGKESAFRAGGLEVTADSNRM